MIWSYNEADPTGADAMQHDRLGSRSLNLIGGQLVKNTGVSEDEPFLDFTVKNVKSVTTFTELLQSKLINTGHHSNYLLVPDFQSS